MRPLILSAAFACLLPLQALADAARVDRLIAATNLPRVLEVMRTEGIDYALDLEQSLFPGKGGAAWEVEAARIHDSDRALEDMRAAMIASPFAGQIDDIIAFFESDLGQKVVAAEISARVAMLDEAIDEAASEMAQERAAENDPRIATVRRFIEVNDLVESNVVGGLNANYAFYRGLVDGGAFEEDLTEQQMLAEVWEQEPDLRADSTEWLLSYLYLAYGALDDAELEAYIAASDTEAGAAFNALLFDAFDALFNRLSYELGASAARFMLAEDA